MGGFAETLSPATDPGTPSPQRASPGIPAPPPPVEPARPFQSREGAGSPRRTRPPPTRARGAAHAERGSLHPSPAALCGAVTRNPPPPPRPPPEPRAPHLGARAGRRAPAAAAGASPEPRAARTRQHDPRREPQPPLGRRRRRRFRPCHGVTRGGRSRRDEGGVGSPPSPSPRRWPRPGYFRRCASRGAWGGGRGLGAGEGAGSGRRGGAGSGRLGGAGPGAGRAVRALGARGGAGAGCRVLAASCARGRLTCTLRGAGEMAGLAGGACDRIPEWGTLISVGSPATYAPKWNPGSTMGSGNNEVAS